MNVSVCAELIFRKFSSGDSSDSSGLELVDFEHAVRQARAYKIRYDYFNTVRVEGLRTINTGWLQEYKGDDDKGVDVLFDENTNTYYAVLPAQPISLPHNLGMYHVSPMKNFQEPFMIQTIGESFLFMSNPPDNITFHYDNERIYFDNFDPSIEKVYIQMIPLLSDNIPDEFVAEISEMVLTSFMKSKGLMDKLTNTNPNKEEINNGATA